MINPSVVIPIHKEQPKLFIDKLGTWRKVIVPRPGVLMQLPL